MGEEMAGLKEKRCYVCGDVGFEELLVLCTKCESVYIHIYCMKTIVFIAPYDWVCEDCEETPKHAASKLTDNVRGLKRTVQFIPTDEAIALASHLLLPKGLSKTRLSTSRIRNLICGDSHKNTLKASKNVGEQRPSAGQVENGRFLPNPVSFPTWTGCFRFNGFAAPVSSLDVVWGYPPAKVSRKAFEFTKEMPTALRFTAIPRCTVWAKMFNDQGPDKHDIGLYFLPIGGRSEQCYSCLVAHLEKQDIILRSCIRRVQLLIFSSSRLDEESKKMHHAYYLWGLFVPPVNAINFKEPEQKQSPSMTNTEPAIQQQTVDMEIDMLGGATVGRIDIPIPINSHLSCSKTSKAAVESSQPAPETQVKPKKWDILASKTSTEPAIQHVLEDNQAVDMETNMLGGTPVRKIDPPVPRDSHKMCKAAVASSQPVPVTQVKAEKWDGEDLAFPPGFPARAAWAEPRVPPGFEENGRLKYKSISEILQSGDGKRS